MLTQLFIGGFGISELLLLMIFLIPIALFCWLIVAIIRYLGRKN